MSKNNPYIQLLRRTFPNASIPAGEEFFTDEFIDDDKHLGVANQKSEAEALDAIAEGLKAAHSAYASLDAQVRKALDCQFKKNSLARLKSAKGTTLVVSEDPAQYAVHLSNVLSAMRYSLEGRWPNEARKDDAMVEQPCAIQEAKKRAARLTPRSGQAERYETWQRVALVKKAIRCWEIYGDGEPEMYGEPFKNFLQSLSDLQDQHGKREWDAADLVKSYKLYENRLKD